MEMDVRLWLMISQSLLSHSSSRQRSRSYSGRKRKFLNSFLHSFLSDPKSHFILLLSCHFSLEKPGEVILSLPPTSLFCTRELLSSSKVSSQLIPTKETPSNSIKPQSSNVESSTSESIPKPSLPLTTSQVLSLVLFAWKISSSKETSSTRRNEPNSNASGDSGVDVDVDMEGFEREINREPFFESLPKDYRTSPVFWKLSRESSKGLEVESKLAESLLESLPTTVGKMVDEVEKRFREDWEAVKGVLVSRKAASKILHLHPSLPHSFSALDDSADVLCPLWSSP